MMMMMMMICNDVINFVIPFLLMGKNYPENGVEIIVPLSPHS